MKTKNRVWDANKDDLLDIVYLLLGGIPIYALVWLVINV